VLQSTCRIAAFCAAILSGCSQHAPLPPLASDGDQSAARAAFEQILAAHKSGDRETIGNALSQQALARGQREDGKTTNDKSRVVESVRQAFGENPKITKVYGTRTGTVIEIERSPGKFREFEMLKENGTWKLQPFSS
jgi:hypothetical protein